MCRDASRTQPMIIENPTHLQLKSEIASLTINSNQKYLFTNKDPENIQWHDDTCFVDTLSQVVIQLKWVCETEVRGPLAE